MGSTGYHVAYRQTEIEIIGYLAYIIITSIAAAAEVTLTLTKETGNAPFSSLETL